MVNVMKKKVSKKILFIVFTLLWFCLSFRDLGRVFLTDDSVALLIVGLSWLLTIALNLVKNNTVVWLVAFVVTMLVNIEDFEMAVLMVPIISVTTAYKELSGNNFYFFGNKEKPKDNSGNQEQPFYLFSILAVVFSLGLLAYIMFASANPLKSLYYTRFNEIEFVIFFMVLVSYLIESVIQREKKNIIIAVLAIVFYIEYLFCCYAILGGTILVAKVILSPWYMFICTILFNEDKVVLNFYEKIDKMFTSFAQKKQVEE